MKKFITILLALAMILTLTLPAFATNATLTITDTDRTYVGYKLLNLTTSLKTEQHPAACTDGQENGKHVDGCYNYAYSVNAKYKDILQAQAGGREIITYLSSLTGDNNTATLRPAADAIYRAILKYNETAAQDEKLLPDYNPDERETTTQTQEIEQGYWLFADVSDLQDGENANSLVMVDTAGLAGVTINPKTALPTVEKKVKDDEANTPNWQDSADYDIGDEVPFKLKGTLPANLSSYETYSIIFHDTLSAGFTYNDNAVVKVGDADVTAKFTITSSPNNDGTTTLTIECADVLHGNIPGVNKNTLFEVFYSADLNEKAKIGPEGNPNEVYLEYSNDPYGNSTGKTKEDRVKVFTYELVINKIDGVTQDPLAGAKFTLSRKIADDDYELVTTFTTNDTKTSFIWKGLDAGEYRLEETDPPAGYNKLDAPIYITITARHDIESANPTLTELTSTKGTADVTSGVITETIKNNTGSVLPETGAKGTMWLIFGGAALVMVAAVFMITRKKMSVFED